MKPKQDHKVQHEFLYISISFFILVVAWVGFNLYDMWATSTITQDLQIQIIPIAPTFDTSVFQKLKTRTQVSPVDSFPNAPSTQPQESYSSSPSAQQPTPPTAESVGL